MPSVPTHCPSTRERAALGEVAQDLADEERIALGLAVDRLGEGPRGLLLADRVDERLHLVAVETTQEGPLVEVLAAERGDRIGERVRSVELDVAVRAHDQDALAAQVAGEVLEEQQRRLVGPVQVVEDQDQRAGRRRVGEEGRHAFE